MVSDAPGALLRFTRAVMVKLAVPPAGRLASVSVTWLPAFPGVKVGPDVWAWETKVRPAGRRSLRVTDAASLGPALVSVTV